MTLYCFQVQNVDVYGGIAVAFAWKRILEKLKVFGKLKKNGDITRSKEALEKDFEQLKENIIYSQRLARIGSWTHDIKKDEIFRSDEVFQILGCTSQDLDNKLESFYSHIHPDDAEKVREVDQRAINCQEYDIEYRIVTPDGMERYVHEKTKVLLDEENNPAKMIGIMQDITEHKLLENNLKAIGDNLNRAQRVSRRSRQLEIRY